MWCSDCETNSILISGSFFVSFQHRSHAFLQHFNNGNGVPSRNDLLQTAARQSWDVIQKISSVVKGPKPLMLRHSLASSATTNDDFCSGKTLSCRFMPCNDSSSSSLRDGWLCAWVSSAD